MSYVKHTWETGQTIDATRLNEMENGIASGGGSRGADWNAEEGEDGYIENKPFYETIEEVSGLPKTYWNNLLFTDYENSLREYLEDDEWTDAEVYSYLGYHLSDIYGFSCIGITYDQCKEYYYIKMGVEITDEEVISQFGSKDAFGAQLAAQLKEECTGNVVYMGESFSYTTQQMIDISKLINVVASADINSVNVTSYPITLTNVPAVLYNGTQKGTYSSIDVLGNSSLFYLDGPFINEINSLTSQNAINHSTNDKFYFAIGKLVHSNGLTTYTIDILFADANYFSQRTETVTVPVRHDFTAVSGAAEGYQRYQAYGVEIDDESPIITFTNSSTASGSVKAGIYGRRMSTPIIGSVEYPGYLILKFSNNEVTKYPDYESTDVLSESSFSYLINTTELKVTLKISQENSEEYAYIDVPNTWSVVTEKQILRYYGTTYFNYTLTSAEKSTITYLDNKFIKKPDWWFGEKEYIITEPTHFLKNVSMVGELERG